MFDKARYTTIHGGTFTQHTHLPAGQSSSEPALFQLLEHSALGATYDVQAHPPCHPGTPALRTVSDWMYSPRSSKKPVLWLHGASQALNSSIAKHVADKCAQRGELAGSFFFSSEPARPKQDSITHLVPTLALQLARSPLRGFQPALLTALHEDPTPIRQPIPTQVERMILEPLQGVTSPGPFLVIIDALDQCEGEENQREVLAQLARIVREPHNPLRFIITSANAPHLRRAFDASDLKVVSASSSIVVPPQLREGEPLQVGQAAAQAVALFDRSEALWDKGKLHKDLKTSNCTSCYAPHMLGSPIPHELIPHQILQNLIGCHGMDKLPNVLCRALNCKKSTGGARSANKGCTALAGPFCLQCCKALPSINGCGQHKVSPTEPLSVDALRLVLGQESTPTPIAADAPVSITTTTPPVAATTAPPLPPPRSYARPLTNQYASAMEASQDARTARMAIAAQQKGLSDTANAVKNTIHVLFWTEPGLPHSFKIVSYYPDYFIPKEHPLLIEALPGNTHSVTTLDSYPATGDGQYGTWTLQDLSVPCLGLQEEALRVPALLRASRYTHPNPPPTPITKPLARTLTDTGLPPTPAATPVRTLTPANAPKPRFPPVLFRDMDKAMKVFKRVRGSSRKEAKFAELFPGVRFAASTFNRHSFIFCGASPNLKTKYRGMPDALWDEFRLEAKDCPSMPGAADIVDVSTSDDEVLDLTISDNDVDILDLTSDNDETSHPPPPPQNTEPTNPGYVICTGSLSFYRMDDFEAFGEDGPVTLSTVGTYTPPADTTTQFFIDLSSDLACSFGFKKVYKGYHMLPAQGVFHSDTQAVQSVNANPAYFKTIKPDWQVGRGGVFELGVQLFHARNNSFRFKYQCKHRKLTIFDFEILEAKMATPGSAEYLVMQPVEGRYLENVAPVRYLDPTPNKNRELIHDVLDTFSHYVFHESDGQQVYTGFQGRYQANGQGVNIFDFDIHTRDTYFTTYQTDYPGNRGQAGLNNFMVDHTCNLICLSLGLPDLADRILTMEY
ncbi:hypothetical protein DXG01_014054 [Tephrocybe rancida]|nr:hypothetical protein DXG01_014054 [Tephrocybe rancida]